jgi:polysaccharide biosynthesis protein PslA
MDRFLEISLSLTALLVLLPLLLFIALLVKVTSPGPVFCMEEKLRSNRELLKFRTSRIDCEQKTLLGVFLIKTRLDELPHLIDVLVTPCPKLSA